MRDFLLAPAYLFWRFRFGPHTVHAVRCAWSGFASGMNFRGAGWVVSIGLCFGYEALLSYWLSSLLQLGTGAKRTINIGLLAVAVDVVTPAFGADDVGVIGLWPVCVFCICRSHVCEQRKHCKHDEQLPDHNYFGPNKSSSGFFPAGALAETFFTINSSSMLSR
jgi:hypothetical protein